MINWSLGQLSTFLAVAETRSFRVAAERLALSTRTTTALLNEVFAQRALVLLDLAWTTRIQADAPGPIHI